MGGGVWMKNKDKNLLIQLFIIAIPIAIQNLINVGVSVTDTLMIGNIDELQLAGISQANQPYFIFTTLIFGLASGSMVLNSQYWGKRDIESIKTIMGLMMRIAIVGGLIASLVVLIFPKEVVSVFTNEKVVIEISDDGPGFDEKDLDKIFERFYKGKGGKYGLGLAITKTIIKKHHGSIMAENNKKGGALFRIIL